MSCSFWNMRRRLRKQREMNANNEGKVITDIATAQAEETAKTETKAVKKNDSRTSRTTKNRDKSDN